MELLLVLVVPVVLCIPVLRMVDWVRGYMRRRELLRDRATLVSMKSGLRTYALELITIREELDLKLSSGDPMVRRVSRDLISCGDSVLANVFSQARVIDSIIREIDVRLG